MKYAADIPGLNSVNTMKLACEAGAKVKLSQLGLNVEYSSPLWRIFSPPRCALNLKMTNQIKN